MLVSISLGLLLAGKVLSQQEHALDGHSYEGCFAVGIPYDSGVELGPENCTPEACQEACTGSAYAGVFSE